MKKLFTLFACASLAFTLSAQDSSQPKGTWYLGAGDATEILDIFVDGINMDASVGYAVADGVVISLYQSAGSEFGGSLSDTDNFNLSLGGQYFIGDYYVGAVLQDPLGDIDFGLNAGRFIPVRDMFYLAPQINLTDLSDENGRNVNVTIGFGARF